MHDCEPDPEVAVAYKDALELAEAGRAVVVVPTPAGVTVWSAWVGEGPGRVAPPAFLAAYPPEHLAIAATHRAHACVRERG